MKEEEEEGKEESEEEREGSTVHGLLPPNLSSKSSRLEAERGGRATDPCVSPPRQGPRRRTWGGAPQGIPCTKSKYW